ncbi:MAG: ZIP family metal transporter [Vicinamibacterales bacterium]
MALEVFLAALVSDLATGLGVLPFLFLDRVGPRWNGMAAATASGMMLSASVFALADRALHRGGALPVIVGMLAGALFFAWTARLVEERHWTLGDWSESESRKSILLITTMFIHSVPEGIAIGVGYATGEIKFGLLLAAAIAVHNIPEGTAVALPLRARGASLWQCAGYAILTSVPQPLLAVPAFILTSFFQPLVAPSLGFAGGAMIFLVMSELLPESLESCTRSETAWSVTLGLIGMLGFTAALGL